MGHRIRCLACVNRENNEITYTIEDLDAIDGGGRRSRSFDVPTTSTCPGPADEANSYSGGARRYSASDDRWVVDDDPGPLSPDDAILWTLKKHAVGGTQFRWALSTSKTDIDVVSTKTRCSCHQHGTPTTPNAAPAKSPGRGDLRKHHSAEVNADRWSLRPESPQTPQMYELRRHNSEDARMDREAKWTLQVPEVQRNPKPRCSCPKPKISIQLSREPSDEDQANKLLLAQQQQQQQQQAETAPSPKELLPACDETAAGQASSRSLTPEPKDTSKDSSDAPSTSQITVATAITVKRVSISENVILRASPPQLSPRITSTPKTSKFDSAPRTKAEAAHLLTRTLSIIDSPTQRRKSAASADGAGKKGGPRRHSKWTLMPHFSLQVGSSDKSKKMLKSQESFFSTSKTKSLKDRPKYSIRRSMSPEPDPRAQVRPDSRIVRRLISSEVHMDDPKWAPYEESSPLPNIGMKRREPKKLSEINWAPYDTSPTDESGCSNFPSQDPDDSKDWSFQNVTPTHCPPPTCDEEEDKFRMRILNQVAPFPMFMGGWKDESPPRTPSHPPAPPRDGQESPVWSPLVSSTPYKVTAPSPSPPPHKPAPLVVVESGSSRFSSVKKHMQRLRAKSDAGKVPIDEQLLLLGGGGTRTSVRSYIARAASEDPAVSGKQRPQLMRSKALLDQKPKLKHFKRSKSEDVPRYRVPRERRINRAKSEEAPKYDPWYSCDNSELREYVTTV